ncbi:hypothetical protein ACHAQH_008201 [Verticillium albo-atrum]
MVLSKLLTFCWVLLATIAAAEVLAVHAISPEHNHLSDTQPALANSTTFDIQQRDGDSSPDPKDPGHWQDFRDWPPRWWQWGFLNCRRVVELEKQPKATCEYHYENCPGVTHVSYTISIEDNGETNPYWCWILFVYIAKECN